MTKAASFYLRATINTALTPKKYRKDYWQSLKKSKKAEQNPLPWMNYKVIEYLETHTPEKSRIFEYGSGSSTEYWLNKGHQVTSVEHDQIFYRTMVDKLKSRCDYHLIEPELSHGTGNSDPESPDSFVSTDFKGFIFEQYVKSVDLFNDETLDMVIIDGRARPSCIKRAIPKIKSQGILVLDNSDRDYYLSKTRFFLEGWTKQTFRGTVRGLLHLEQTTVFHKP